MNINTKILEVLNQILMVVIYGIAVSKLTNPIDVYTNVLAVFGIIVSISIMFFVWYLNSEEQKQKEVIFKNTANLR